MGKKHIYLKKKFQVITVLEFFQFIAFTDLILYLSLSHVYDFDFRISGRNLSLVILIKKNYIFALAVGIIRDSQ